ncbi:cyclin-domain-containing protein [Halteromyces radiatus]|uniref:cyclin-domain-containing protein n=1 Tax=Halteromyces radiatus TaxID=101107 RepID=UPI00221F3099|nr:cyclin-domain-containing protein [Halteromyces radiatus]KAI8099927.1 cyclin-domain-containing protein [Halteromyces radiatus]
MLSPTFDLAQYPTIDTIRLLASLLERMTNANDQLNKAQRKGTNDMRRSCSASPLVSSTTTNTTFTLFHARSIPSIDIYSYLSRILKYCPCANECFLSLLVYFDRMSKNTLATTGQPFTIDSYNIHRLIISGVMVSSKFFSDIFYTNTRYAKVGGLPVSELNRLELEFLQLNSFNISVSINELQRYGDQLLKVGLMEQEMRMLCDPSSYTVRHGRSTSLGSTALVRTLDGFEGYKQRKSLDTTPLIDGTGKLCLEDNVKESKRHSGSSITKQKDLYTYASPSTPPQGKMAMNGQTMRRMGSMGSLHTSPVAMTATKESHQTVMTTPPLYVQPQQRYQRYSFVDSSMHSPPIIATTSSNHQLKTRQRHESMGLYGKPNPDGWRPRQTRSSVNLYQHNSIWNTSSVTPILDPNHHHHQQPQQQQQQQQSYYQQYPQVYTLQHFPSGGRRLSLTSVHAPPFIPQRPASAEYSSTGGFYYPVSTCYQHPIGIPTPPPSSSPHQIKADSPSHQLYL